MKPTIFIHTNDSQMIGAKVAACSFKSRSSHPDKFDVQIIKLTDYPLLMSHEGDRYKRKGGMATWHNNDLQSFSPLRFLPPQLMDYSGRAVVVDPDVFAVGDIYDLLQMDMNGKAIMARLTKSAYKGDSLKPFYATSVMLLDCEKLKHWQWERKIEEMFQQVWDYGDWISLRQEPDDTIGLLPEEWNHLDVLNRHTKLLHTTERSTQPWKTGLPVDFDLNYDKKKDNKKNNGKKIKLKKHIISLIDKLRGNSDVSSDIPEKFYKKHPDQLQEQLFFSYLKACLDQKLITLSEVQDSMARNFVRHDALDILRDMKPFEWSVVSARD